MLGRVGARGAARHQQKRKEPVKQASWFLRRLHLESFDDEAEDDLHSTTTAFEVHVERFLAQLPNLHRRDLAREFFQLSRALVALQNSEVGDELVEALVQRLAEGLRKGGRNARWVLYAAAIKSMARGQRRAQLPASLGLLAALAGESLVLIGGGGGGDNDDDATGNATVRIPRLDQMLADVFGPSEAAKVTWHRGRDPVGREVPEAGVAPRLPPPRSIHTAAADENASDDSGDEDHGRRRQEEKEAEEEEEEEACMDKQSEEEAREVEEGEKSGNGGDAGGVKRRGDNGGSGSRGGVGCVEAACDTAQVWVAGALVASVTHAHDDWCLTGDLERDRGVIFQLPATSATDDQSASGHVTANFDVDVMAAETREHLTGVGTSEAGATLRLSLKSADVEAAAAPGADGPEAVLLSHSVCVFLSHIRRLSYGGGAYGQKVRGGGGGGGGERRCSESPAGITDDQAARCAYILKVAAWGNSYAEVTLRDCVLLQYLAARPGCTRNDINVVFQAFAWREATGKEAECPVVSAIAAISAAELVEAAVQRVEEAHVEFHGAGEGSLAAGVATPHSEDVTNLVDRLLAAAAGSGGEDGAAAPESVKDDGEGTRVVAEDAGRRRLNTYGEVVRDRVLKRLEAGAKAHAAEVAASLKLRFSFGGKRRAKAAAEGGIRVGAAPLVLVCLIAPPSPAADGPQAAGRNAALRVGDVGTVVAPQRMGEGGRDARGSGTHCVADWWGAGVEASVHWSDVELVHSFQAWMSLPVVHHARKCLEGALAALQLERDRCVAAEEELWDGHWKFVRKCGGGEGAYLWVSGEQEAELFAEFVDHVMAPARDALLPAAERLATAQARMILAEAAAVDRSMDPLARWCALYPGRGGAPPELRARIRAMVKAARVRVEDLEEDARQLEAFCHTAGCRAERLAEALGAVCYVGEKLDMHTCMWV